MKLPVITGKELARALEKAGFERVRQRGSHLVMRHPDGRTTVVPQHAGETISKGLLRKIMRDTELSREELSNLL